MKNILVVLAVIVLIGVCFKTDKENNIVIPDNSLRLRVVANSNNIEDYQVKMKVKDTMEKYLSELLKNANSIEDTKKIISDNLSNIDKEIEKVLKPLEMSYHINYGENYFPSKIYKGVIYEEGDYDSLVISIGEGGGDNWWCVLFPPLCLMEETENVGDVEYQLYVTRIINAFK